MKQVNSNQIKKIIILLVFFIIVWQIYKMAYVSRYGDILGEMKFAEVPYSVKCAFNEPDCEKGDLDGWSLVNALLFFIIGLIIPDKYLIIIVISVVLEILQPYFGNSSRYIINPLVNITGYAIGSLVNSHYRKMNYKTKYPNSVI